MPSPDLTDFQLMERLFLALGDKTRLKLLALMADGPVYVGSLVDRLGESQPKVSRHLAYMRQAGIVSTERDGKWIYYGIKYPDHAAVREILQTVVRSLVAMRVDGEYIYFTQTQSETGALIDGEMRSVAPGIATFERSDDAFQELDTWEMDGGEPLEGEVRTGEEYVGIEEDDLRPREDEQDMEVFLL